MGLVLFSTNIISNIGEKYDVEAELQSVIDELKQCAQISQVLADGKIEAHELEGLDYNNIPIFSDFQQRTAKTVGKELAPIFNFYKKQYAPQDHGMLKEYLLKSLLEKKGKSMEMKMHYREKLLMQKKAKLEARLRIIESTQKSYEQGGEAAIKNFAPKFVGGGQ